MPTIKDVAKEAGVSIATVSYVLKDDVRISLKTKEKVKKAIEKLDYTPNLVAQSLKINRLNIIVIIIASFRGPIYQAMIDDMIKIFASRGYISIVTSGSKALDFVKSNQVAGAIVFDSTVNQKDIIKTAKNGSIIITRRNLFIKDKTISLNYIDGYYPSKEVILNALDEGLNKIMYIHGDKNTIDDSERYNGYLDALDAAHKTPFRVLDGNFTEESGYQVIESYCKKNQELPDLIYAANDEMAIGAIKYLNEKERLVPQKIKVLGYDDIELSRYVSPSLSTIHVNREDWAQFVSNLMIKTLEQKELNNDDIIFKSEYKIIRRESF